MYSYGILLYEIAMRCAAWGHEKFWYKIEDMVKAGERPEITPNCCSPSYMALIKECWQDNALQRPSFDDLVARVLSLINEIVAGKTK